MTLQLFLEEYWYFIVLFVAISVILNRRLKLKEITLFRMFTFWNEDQKEKGNIGNLDHEILKNTLMGNDLPPKNWHRGMDRISHKLFQCSISEAMQRLTSNHFQYISIESTEGKNV